jgi:hypothetical protein
MMACEVASSSLRRLVWVAGWLVNENEELKGIENSARILHSGHERSYECPVTSEYRGIHRILASLSKV